MISIEVTLSVPLGWHMSGWVGSWLNTDVDSLGLGSVITPYMDIGGGVAQFEAV